MLSQGVGYAITALGYIAAAGGKAVLVKEVAEAAWFLATASYVTGQTIAVSGGYGI